jgi:xylulokinase
MALTWLSEQIFKLPTSAETMTNLVAEAETVPPGSRGLVFLPYLIGERTPHMDPTARGVYFGLSTAHGRADLVRATIEGIAFAAYDAYLALRSLGGEPTRVYLAGGGARFRPWRQAVADVFGLPVVALEGEDHTAIGAAILAGAAAGLHDPVAAALAWRTEAETTVPIDGNRALYQDLFGVFQRTYQSLKSDMRYLAELASNGELVSAAPRPSAPGNPDA